MRVVTLLPSATEIVYALGVEPVGVSHECDYPPAVRNRPAVNRSRIDADASSAEIDAQIQAGEHGGDIYQIDRECLGALNPDLVISQGICDVCAIDEVLVRKVVSDLGLEARVLTTDPHTIDDVLEEIKQIGDAINRAKSAKDLCAKLESRINTVSKKNSGSKPGPRVAILDWLEPPMVAGHWIPKMVEYAGGSYGLADSGARSRPREWEELQDYDPEILIAAPCGFTIDQTLADRACLTDRPGWANLSAVENGDVYMIDGHHYVNRPGPRLVDTLEALELIIDGHANEIEDEICRRLEPLSA